MDFFRNFLNKKSLDDIREDIDIDNNENDTFKNNINIILVI